MKFVKKLIIKSCDPEELKKTQKNSKKTKNFLGSKSEVPIGKKKGNQN